MVLVKVGSKSVETRNIRSVVPKANGGAAVIFDGMGSSDDWTATMVTEYLAQVKGLGVITKPVAESLSATDGTEEANEEMTVADNRNMY